jgi:hypothetical protein
MPVAAHSRKRARNSQAHSHCWQLSR